MSEFSIIDARAYHCGQMARRLRVEHARCITLLGIATHYEMRRSFDESFFRRAWLIDGELSALGGVMGTTLQSAGFVWLALSQSALRYPVAIVKEARRQLAEIMLLKRELATTILPGDDAALRLAIFLGFHVSHGGLGDRAYSRAGRRTLAQYVETESACHVPIGDHHLIAMGYEAA